MQRSVPIVLWHPYGISLSQISSWSDNLMNSSTISIQSVCAFGPSVITCPYPFPNHWFQLTISTLKSSIDPNFLPLTWLVITRSPTENLSSSFAFLWLTWSSRHAWVTNTYVMKSVSAIVIILAILYRMNVFACIKCSTIITFPNFSSPKGKWIHILWHVTTFLADVYIFSNVLLYVYSNWGDSSIRLMTLPLLPITRSSGSSCGLSIHWSCKPSFSL